MSTSLLLTEVALPVFATVLLFFALCFFWVGYLLLRGNKNEYERNRARVKRSFWNIFLGTVPTAHDGVRDDKVCAGVALNKNTNRWISQGRLSDEALEDILAP
jgi:hypothetical protein